MRKLVTQLVIGGARIQIEFWLQIMCRGPNYFPGFLLFNFFQGLVGDKKTLKFKKSDWNSLPWAWVCNTEERVKFDLATG